MTTATDTGSWTDWSGKNPWHDWESGKGGGDSGSPMSVVVSCPIGANTGTARVKLPKPMKPGSRVVAQAQVEGISSVKFPHSLTAALVDLETVEVELSAKGPTVEGPEYEPPKHPGGSKTAKPVPPGTPMVVVVVFPPASQQGGQPIPAQIGDQS